jgi:hypothetical protein
LAFLSEHGLDAVVIGGCAVGAYARLMGETVLTTDLDLYTDRVTLEEIALAAPERRRIEEAEPGALKDLYTQLRKHRTWPSE